MRPSQLVFSEAGLPMRGDITIRVRSAKTGEQIRKIEVRNTITFLGLQAVVQLLAQRAADPTALSLSIGRLRLGTGITAPTKTDTTLADANVSPAHYSYEFVLGDANKVLSLGPSTFEIRILDTLDQTQGNGLSLTEAGLFTRGATNNANEPTAQLVARQIHPAIPKTAALILDYDWRVAFSA